jgi:NUMOD3 motif
MMGFYSYLWLRVDGTPYYAGKGMGRRAFVRGSHHLRPPENQKRILIFPMVSEAEALESEIALIELFGRKDLGTGCLRNFTNGGDGVSGYRATNEARQQRSEAYKGRHLSPATEFKAGQAGVRKGKLGYKETAEHRRKIGEAHKGHRPYNTAAGNEKCSRTKMGCKASEETKQRMSESGKAAWLRRKAQGIVQL